MLNAFYEALFIKRRSITKMMRIMNITAILLLVCCLVASARVSSQGVTLNVKNAPLDKVFEEIKNQTAYTFMYTETMLKEAKNVSINVKNSSLQEVLSICFAIQPFTYKIIDQTVILQPKEQIAINVNRVMVLPPPPPIEIHGRVVNQQGEPLQNVSVLVAGTKIGTTTNNDGRFTLTAPDNKNIELEISHIGFKTKRVSVGKQTEINVTLEEEVSGLNEVVVVGYGTQRRADITGSISSIKEEDIAIRPVANPLDALSAKVPGLQVSSNSGAPGGSMKVNIRGINSISAGNDPLYVVDGIIDGSIELINPNDIESVDVLKDASSTAIYGVRGANGVIIITTKRAKSGITSINYNGNFSIAQVARAPKMVDAYGFLEYYKRAWSYDATRGPVPDLHTLVPDLINPDGTPKYNVDWNKEVLQNSPSQKHFISVSGGTLKSKQTLTLGYINENGLLINTYYKNNTARFTNELKVNEAITIGGELGYSLSPGQSLNPSSPVAAWILRGAGEYNPLIPVKYPNGEYSRDQDFLGLWTIFNPVKSLREFSDVNTVSQLIGNAYGNVKLSKSLSLRTSFSSRIIENERNINTTPFLDFGGSGYTRINYGKSNYWQLDNVLNYNKRISEHQFNMIIGSTQSNRVDNASGLSVTNTRGNLFSYYNISANAIDPSLERITSNWAKVTTNSYFARLNYILSDKYLLTITSRYDGASMFGDANKYAFFPSGALGWVASNEKFLKDSKTVSFLKVRASYGKTGNSAIAPYATLGLINISPLFINNQGAPAATPSTLANPKLQWEKTSQSDLGLDLKMFGDRLTFTADIYKKITSNLLFSEPISTVSGYNSIFTNIGKVQNVGLELSLFGDLVKTKDWNVNVGGILSTNKNKILELSNDNKDIFGGVSVLGLQPLIFRVGQPLGSFWAVHREGTWGTAEKAEAATWGKKPGDIKLQDVNKDHKINSDDASISGNIFPKYTAAISLTVRYKNFQLNTELQIVQGNKVFNGNKIVFTDWGGAFGRAYKSTITDAWTPEHQDTKIPQLRFSGDANFFQSFVGYLDDFWLEDGSFIRGKNINLSYSFPQKITRTLGLNGLKVYANVQNFFLISKYQGYDPEVGGIFDGGTFGQGMDFYGYPKPRTYTFGINVNL